MSVETNDIITTLCHFLDGEMNYCAAVNDKQNTKNDRPQTIDGSNVASVGKCL